MSEIEWQVEAELMSGPHGPHGQDVNLHFQCEAGDISSTFDYDPKYIKSMLKVLRDHNSNDFYDKYGDNPIQFERLERDPTKFSFFDHSDSCHGVILGQKSINNLIKALTGLTNN